MITCPSHVQLIGLKLKFNKNNVSLDCSISLPMSLILFYACNFSSKKAIISKFKLTREGGKSSRVGRAIDVHGGRRFLTVRGGQVDNLSRWRKVGLLFGVNIPASAQSRRDPMMHSEGAMVDFTRGFQFLLFFCIFSFSF